MYWNSWASTLGDWLKLTCIHMGETDITIQKIIRYGNITYLYFSDSTLEFTFTLYLFIQLLNKYLFSPYTQDSNLETINASINKIDKTCFYGSFLLMIVF